MENYCMKLWNSSSYSSRSYSSYSNYSNYSNYSSSSNNSSSINNDGTAYSTRNILTFPACP